MTMSEIEKILIENEAKIEKKVVEKKIIKSNEERKKEIIEKIEKKVAFKNEDNSKNIFMKNNTLIQTKYDLTSTENKIYLFLSSNLKKINNSEGIGIVEFKRKELEPTITNEVELQVNRITKMFSRLRKKSIYIKSINDNGDEYWGEYGFINSYDYIPNKDTFRVKMDIKISELIMEKYFENGGYTPLNLNILYNLKSIYAQRIYELLRRWTWTRYKINYNLNDFKAYLGLDKKKSYERYNNIKNKVLEPAINELNETGVLNIAYDEEKVGRKVIGINFYVEDLEERQYFKDNSILKITKEEKNPYNNNLDLSIFTKGTLKMFKKDFGYIDFSNKEYEDIFLKAVAKSLEKDNVEIISVNTYTYFKNTLIGMISDYEFKKGQDAAQEKFF